MYIYIAALNEFVLGVTPFALRLTSVELTLLIAFCLFLLVRGLTLNPTLARWMALFALLIPSVFFYARVSTAENVSLTATMSVALVFLMRLDQEPAWQRAVLAGLTVGLCAYTYHVGRLLPLQS